MNKPNFVIGEENMANSPNTLAVRETIGDMFNGGKNGWELQCTEGAAYFVLTVLGVKIDWKIQSGRNGGKWDDIFEQFGQYQVLDNPEPNCSMHIGAGLGGDKTNEIGHTAFVTEVFPDKSIKVKEVNWPRHGIYNERVIPFEKWKNQYKARFVRYTKGATNPLATLTTDFLIDELVTRPNFRDLLLARLPPKV